MSTGRVPTTANSPLTAKGDLFGYSTTQARVAVGSDGDTLVADSAATTGLRWQGNYAAGKNVVLNSDFRIAQRGTSFSVAVGTYTLDRWRSVANHSGGTLTYSQQTFTPGTAPVAGYEGANYLRIVGASPTGATVNVLTQRIEDVRTFAGQTVTISFWAKADSTRTVTPAFIQDFGSGGSSEVGNTGSSISVTTSWARYSQTFSIASISGKTIGTSSFLGLEVRMPINVSSTLEFWGVQLEAGSVPTAFQTATGTLQGELAAAQRYYTRETVANNYTYFRSSGNATNTTQARIIVPLPVQMRTKPSALDYGGALAVSDGVNLYTTGTFVLSANSSPQSAQVEYTHGTGALTQYRYMSLQDNNNGATYVGFSAEL